ncbi:MAG: hypothetical protein Q8R18_01200 [bacterium]|nr:hypothetical protein [bacterium]
MDRNLDVENLFKYGRRLGPAHEKAPVLCEDEILVGLVVSCDVYCKQHLDFVSMAALDLNADEHYRAYFQKLEDGDIFSLQLYALSRKDVEFCSDGSVFTFRSLLSLVEDLSRRISSI